MTRSCWRRMYVTMILAVGCLLAGAPLYGQDREAELDSVLSALHEDGLFDGAVAIAESGEVAFAAGYGSYEGERVTPTTPIYLASVSKAMTATIVLSLAAEGEVELDAPVGRYVEPWPYSEITVRHLLNQTSGLHFFTTITAHHDTTEALSTAGLLALVDEYRPGLGFEPGTEFAYDNANYAVLAALIESVTGRPYPEVMRERVFEPAGMEHAYVGSSGEAGWISWSGGDGDGVHASALDLLAFDHAFWTGKIVPMNWVRQADDPPRLPGEAETRYIFGRFVNEQPRLLIGHFGEGMKAKTGLWRERNSATTYTILNAGDGVHRTAILTAAMGLWNGESVELPKARPVADVPADVLQQHVGVYDSGMGRLHITLEDGMLHLEPEGAGGSEPLIPAADNIYYFEHQDLTWQFVKNDAGETTGMMLRGHPETLGTKVE